MFVVGIIAFIVMLCILYGGIKRYLKTKKIGYLILTSIFVAFFAYTVFTYSGALKLSAAITSGDFYNSYTSDYKKESSKSKGNITYYMPVKSLQIESGGMAFIECREYFVLKFCSYYGFE